MAQVAAQSAEAVWKGQRQWAVAQAEAAGLVVERMEVVEAVGIQQGAQEVVEQVVVRAEMMEMATVAAAREEEAKVVATAAALTVAQTEALEKVGTLAEQATADAKAAVAWAAATAVVTLVGEAPVAAMEAEEEVAARMVAAQLVVATLVAREQAAKAEEICVSVKQPEGSPHLHKRDLDRSNSLRASMQANERRSFCSPRGLARPVRASPETHHGWAIPRT